MSATQALTIIAPIDPVRRPALDAALIALQREVGLDTELVPATHFTRFAIIEDAPGHDDAMLAWESNHDGRADDYLELVLREVPAIDRIFAACVGYPAAGDLAAKRGWLQGHAHRAAAFYCAYRGVPRRDVVNDGEVHAALRELVDRDRATLWDLPAHEIQRRLCAAVCAERPGLATSTRDDAWRHALARLVASAKLVALVPIVLVIFVPWYVMLRAHEERDRDAYRRARSGQAAPVHDRHDRRLDEDVVRQNQLTHVVDIKPGAFRLFTVWAVLTVIDLLANARFVHGHLGGITSIHFARWVILRDRRGGPRPRHRLVFFSNYDGSWESYLGEFVDRAAIGLTAVWSNTVGFPPSKNLLCQGAADEEAFKQWTRDHQLASQVWWSGVPGSTVQNVRDDLWIRHNLDRTLTDGELSTWLTKL